MNENRKRTEEEIDNVRQRWEAELNEAKGGLMYRKDYMSNLHHSTDPKEKENDRKIFRAYCGQFVTSHELNLVKARFGDRLLKSTDFHLNDIPLKEWDALCSRGLSTKSKLKLTIANGQENSLYEVLHTVTYIYSQSDVNCILKEAARQYIESVTKEVT